MKKTICMLLLQCAAGLFCAHAFAQAHPLPDTISIAKDTAAVPDTSISDAELDAEIDALLDSLFEQPSILNISLGLGNGYFNYQNSASTFLSTQQKIIYTPNIGYYHKSGLGISATAFGINDNGFNFYQFLLSPSYDYLKHKKFSAGLSYTRYFYKDSLPFYISPLNNEVFVYFTWKKSWFKPGLAASYGWGSRQTIEQQEVFIRRLQLRRRGYIVISNEEKANDFNLIASVRHDFKWSKVLLPKGELLLTPVLMLNTGTQKFGLNQSATLRLQGISNSYQLRDADLKLSDNTGFRAQSATFILQADYSVGKFYIQPQFFTDYYIPSSSGSKWSAAFSVNIGFTF
jgi:hypothetical protein